jgi:cytochrome c oxidase subunit IV
MLRDVFRQNHMNAFIIEAITILIVFGLGYLIDYEFFRIPAVASGVLLLAILISLAGVIDFWFKSWKSLAFVMGIFLLNLIVLKFDLVTYSNKAYGLNYTVEPAEYSYASLDALASPENVYNDRKNTLDILNNWKAKTGLAKPKMVLLNFSGGGLGAATFAIVMMQHLDSALNGKLMLNTSMMTGASGGMIGATYWRELYLRQLNGQITSMYDTMYVHNVSKDLLNITMATLVSNDIVYPLQKFKIGDQTYRKDRGYAFEKQLNENTEDAFTKPISAYTVDEKSALIPIMIYAPTIINDHRRLYISAQPVSYLSRPTGKDYRPRMTDVDGVDFQRLFASQGADSLLVSSAVRMNATYPYILPYVTLPTKPVIKVMDAGLRDNFGLSVSAKFAYAFKEWINANTSGVVFVQIRQYKREREIEGYERETFITSLLSPISNIYSNLTSVQDYEQTYLLNAVSEALGGNVELVTLEYNPQKKEEEASLSFHLTDKEKYDIIHTKNDPKIQESIKRLKELLK